MSTAHEVVTAALAVGLPCPVCGSTATCRCLKPVGYSATSSRADLIVQALMMEGLLPTSSTVPTMEDVHEAAMILAARSRHLRYTGTTEGWAKLLQSTADVDMAYAQAASKTPQSEHEALAHAHAMLLAYHEREARKRAEGDL